MSLQTTYLTVPAIGYEGTLQGDADADIITLKNVEASASMPFGRAVAWKTSSPASDKDALLPASTSDKIAGIIVKSNAYERTWTDQDGTVHGSLDSTGIVTGELINVLRDGKIIVKCMTGCAPADRLFVCSTAATTYTAVGQLGNADESSNTVDCTKQGQWLTTAAAGGLAWLDVDFTNKP